MKTKILRKTVVGVFVLMGLGVGDTLPANIMVVTNTNDSGPGSLRQALVDANDGDTIDATGVSGTILLTSGELQIDHNVTINGPGAGSLEVNGNATFTVFQNIASNVTIFGLTITNSNWGIFNYGGLIVSDSSIVNNAGGGIFNDGRHSTVTLTIINSAVNGNGGGGIFSYNTTQTVSNCTVSGNHGGGIFNYATVVPPNGYASGSLKYVPNSSVGTLTVNNCTISSNQGSGITNSSTNVSADLVVSNCTISGNSADNGGGISNTASGFNGGSSAASVSNTTLSGNSATKDGGGIYNHSEGNSQAAASLSLMNCTLSGNSASGNGGGISNEGELGPAELELGACILNAGSSGENIFNDGGTVNSLGYNVSSDDGSGFLAGPGDQINTDPMLGPLQDNGGPTFTHALLPDSPAIDAGDPNFTPPPLYDQRGPDFARVINGRIDIGSFEVQLPKTTPTPRPRPTPAPRP